MNQHEHLKRIRARCVELLALAEKRTKGEWFHKFNGHYDEVNIQDNEYSPSIAITCPMHERTANAIFIASCAGPAEAGWKATIAAIDALFELGTWFKSPTLDELQSKILAAWPEELL